MLVIDVILELIAIVLHKRAHRHGCRVTERTNRAALNSVADNIQGRTICALGDAAAMPVRAFVKHYRDEFQFHIDHKHCLVPTYV